MEVTAKDGRLSLSALDLLRALPDAEREALAEEWGVKVDILREMAEPRSNSREGIAFEYRIRRELIRRGWWPTQPRSGSTGPADLIAMKQGRLILIQCKRGKASISSREREALLYMAEATGGEPLLIAKDHKRGTPIVLRRVTETRYDSLDWDYLGEPVKTPVYAASVSTCWARRKYSQRGQRGR